MKQTTENGPIPASAFFALLTSLPRSCAASRWRSGQAGPVKENTAGELMTTDKP